MTTHQNSAESLGGSKAKEAMEGAHSNGNISTVEKFGVERDSESQKQNLKYPKSVFFIISNEFCERFTYYGIRTILAIYLSSVLGYTKNDSTVIYHTFVLFCYFTPVFGAMLADSLLGRFRTIFYVSIIYAIGNIVLSVGAIPDARAGAEAATMVGLVLIAIGTGGIKPCVSSFGGDQFVLPEQERQQKQFFSVFYFAINSGSLISTFLTPVLRQDVKCFGEMTCYSVAFGIPAIFMIVSLTLFLLGKSMYTMKKPEGNLLLRLCKLMNHSVVQKVKSKGPKKEHWLDYGSDTFEQSFIDDTKSAFKVLALFVPLPVFWALFDQQGSRWTFQAQQMNGVMGSFVLKPDQMQVVNPLLILAFIPLFESVVYPLLAKCHLLTKAIPRIFIGGCFAALAFTVSGIVDLQLEPSLAVVPRAGEGQLRVFNGLHQYCSVIVNSSDKSHVYELPEFEVVTLQHLKVGSNIIADCGNFKENISMAEEKALSYLIGNKNGEPYLYGNYTDDVTKNSEGYPKLRIMFDDDVHIAKFVFKNDFITKTWTAHPDPSDTDPYILLNPGTYTVFADSNEIGVITANQGGVYTMVIAKTGEKYNLVLEVVTPDNNIHMMWLLPQYIIITAGEIMFSITGLEFAFTQAPASMKSVVSACWLLTDSFGNLIVIIIAEARIFEKQAYEYFLFAGIMLAVMLIFLWMSWNYKYVIVADDKDDLEEKSRQTGEKEAISRRNSTKKEAEAYY